VRVLESTRLRATVSMIGAAVLFGTTGTAQAFTPPGTNPLSVGAVRQVIGGSLLLAIGVVWWLRHHGRRLPRWSAKAGWALLGGACVMVFQATFFFGTRGNGVAVGTVIALGSSPLFAGLFDGLRGRRPSRRWLVATALASSASCCSPGCSDGRRPSTRSPYWPRWWPVPGTPATPWPLPSSCSSTWTAYRRPPP